AGRCSCAAPRRRRRSERRSRGKRGTSRVEAMGSAWVHLTAAGILRVTRFILGRAEQPGQPQRPGAAAPVSISAFGPQDGQEKRGQSGENGHEKREKTQKENGTNPASSFFRFHVPFSCH